MQNIFDAWEFKEKMVEDLNFGKTEFKTCVEKNFISYSYILFIKFNALRSFYTKLLCFSKIFFFQNFDRSNLFLYQSKLRLKSLVSFYCFDRCSIDTRSIEAFSINRKSYRECFLKTWFSRVQLTFQKVFKLSLSLSLSSIGQGSNPIFCHFPPTFLQGFSPLRPVRLFYPSFCIYFQVSCIFLGKFQTYNF